MNHIYLDHNATTPIHPCVSEVMTRCFESRLANPASQHQPGRRARKVIEEARDYIGDALGARVSAMDADRLVFTSGGTESNNLALLGLARHSSGNIVISAIEHPSVVAAAEHLQRLGFQLRRARVTESGVLDLVHFATLVDTETRVASVMLGNNETGVLQPVAEAARICADLGVPLHTDAVQVVGKLAVDFLSLGIATLSIAAHKFHGPAGIGALLVRENVELRPLFYGGFQQVGLRPGTESVCLAVGMKEALRLWSEERDARSTRMEGLRNLLEQRITDGCPGSVVLGAEVARLPHTANIAFPGLDRQAILMALDLAGIACSTGSACASGSSEPSPVLLAMGCSKAVVDGSIRISLGALTTPQEIEEAGRRIVKIVNELRGKN